MLSQIHENIPSSHAQVLNTGMYHHAQIKTIFISQLKEPNCYYKTKTTLKKLENSAKK